MKSEAFNFTLRRNGNQDFWHLIFKCKSHSVAETQFLFIPHNQEQMAFSVSWSKITCETGGKHRYVYRYTLESRKLHFEKYTSRLIPLMILITYCQIIEKLFQHPWLSFYSKFPSLRAETEAAWWHTIRYFFFLLLHLPCNVHRAQQLRAVHRFHTVPVPMTEGFPSTWHCAEFSPTIIPPNPPGRPGGRKYYSCFTKKKHAEFTQDKDAAWD